MEIDAWLLMLADGLVQRSDVPPSARGLRQHSVTEVGVLPTDNLTTSFLRQKTIFRPHGLQVPNSRTETSLI